MLKSEDVSGKCWRCHLGSRACQPPSFLFAQAATSALRVFELFLFEFKFKFKFSKYPTIAYMNACMLSNCMLESLIPSGNIWTVWKLSRIFWNYLEIFGLFGLLKLFWNNLDISRQFWNCPEDIKAIWKDPDCPEIFETIWKYSVSFETAWKILKSSRMIRTVVKPSGMFWDHQEIFEQFWNCLEISEIIWK